MTRYVLGFMFTEDLENVLLIKKLKPKWQSGKLNGVGGKIEDNDSSDEWAMYTEDHDWKKFLVLKGRDWECLVYRAISDKAYKYVRMEQEEPVLFKVKDILASNVLPNVKWIIPMALDTEFELSITEYIK